MKLTMTSPKTAGRVAGVLYLILIGLGATAELIRTNLIVPGDATATVNTIRASGDALRISLFADFGAHLSYLLVAVILYSLVRRANNGLSVLFVLMVSISVAMMCLNLVNQVAAIIIVDSPDYLQVFSPEQLDALALFFLELQDYGYVVSGIFFGIWLLPLGIVFFTSRIVPRVIAVLLMIAPIGYLTDLVVRLAAHEFGTVSAIALGFSAVAETSLCIYLLIRGVRTAVPAA
jgi:uncharacterized integral membrane protein